MKKMMVGMKKGISKNALLGAALCFTVLLGSILFAGCNGSSADPADEAQNYDVDLYYANQAYIDEGDESLDHFKEVDKTISATPGGVYLETLKALSETPEGDGYATMLGARVQVNSAAMDTDGTVGTVTVDFKADGISGGSTEETLLIEQIVWTLTESFDNVKRVKFTVGGEAVETLMGHMDVSVPYEVTEVDNGNGEDVETVMPVYE